MPPCTAATASARMMRAGATLRPSAKTGVYQYSDGQSTWGEYVPDSTLRDPDWIASLRIAPLTLDHPA